MRFVPNVVSRGIGRKILVAKKNSPHIFFAGGIAAGIGSTFLACRATLKLEENLDQIKINLDMVKQLRQSGIDGESGYTERDYRRDLGYVYADTAVKLGRLYGPSFVLGAASIAALTGSHVQLTRRNSALTATIALVTQAYDDYRARVQEELGEKREQELYRCMEDVELDDPNGKKKAIQVSNGSYSPYVNVFDETNRNWVNDSEINRLFILCQQNQANHQLQVRGHVMLNDVLDSLGLERSPAGAVVGWLRNGEGDGYIDFGLDDTVNDRSFVSGDPRAIWLDFNVDGVVYDQIGKEKR